jgi:hypothetical protein
MPAKSYSAKYRRLKKVYEKEVGKEVSDSTWSRVVSSLKQQFDFHVESPNSEKLVKVIGDFKRRYRTFSGRSEGFNERWEAFKYFYDMNKDFSGRGFLNALANYLQINLKDVPRSTKYYWFNKADINYKSDQMYKSSDLALVAFIACKWAINKRPETIKTASPEAYKLTK